ncbi:MAG: DUF3786 domain-containing protein [Candidatus Methanomethylicia archaeon]
MSKQSFINWWNWEKTGKYIKSLSGRLGFEESSELHFLGFKINIDNGEVYDEISKRYLKNEEKVDIYYILYMYSQTTQDIGEMKEYTTFTELFKSIKDLALYHCPEFRSVYKRFEDIFEKNPDMLHKAAIVFKHEILDYGDLSIKVYALPRIPIVFTIWKGDDELPPSSSIMFDKTASYYLPDCEALVRLTKITIERLITVIET